MTTALAPLKNIRLGERFRTDYGDIQELADNIKTNGLISPLAVQDAGDGSYDLLAGGRRYQACTLLQMPLVPVRVYPNSLGELSARTIELAENMFRKALSWQEQANLTTEINRLQIAQHGHKTARTADAPGWNQSDTANLLGVDKQTVSNDLRLAKAIAESPEIASCKNKSEALAVLARQEEEVILSEMAKRVQKGNKAKEDMSKQGLINAYITGDFFEGIEKLPNRSYGIVEIDPPYGVDLDELRSAPTGGSHSGAAPGALTGTVSRYADIPADQYPTFMQRVLAAVYPKVADTGWVLLWFGSSRWHDSVREWLFAAGFTPWRLPAMWVKPTTSAIIQPNYCLGSSYEGFYYARKTSLGQIVRKGRSNVFSFKQATHRGAHPTERPVELLQEILSTFGHPGEKVLVPFLGSGNTLLAAANLDMPAVGFEIEPANRNRFIVGLQGQTHKAYTSYKEATA
jgi:ParB/RepB/Spo0J family partition protein